MVRPDPNELLVRFDGDPLWHRFPPRHQRKEGALPGTLCGQYKGKPPAVAQLRRDTEETVCTDCEGRRRIKYRRRRGENEVSNAPLREAFLRSGLSYSDLARRLDKDASWPPRALGLKPRNHRRYRGTYQQWMRVETAARYARALGLDPHEVGV